MSFKVISFDLDGTLLKKDIVNAFWFRELPKLYAKKNKLSQGEALSLLEVEYKKIGSEDVRWYDPHYWFDKFGFEEEPSQIIRKTKDEGKIYRDAIEILEILRNEDRFYLVVFSNSSRDFLEIKIDLFDNYFDRIYSSISDFGGIKKDPKIFKEFCNRLSVRPRDVVHVGDNYEHDVKPASELGINSFMIDRDLKKSKYDKNMIKSLNELIHILSI